MLTTILKKYYLDDSLLAASYEGLCPEAKGWIKKSIAGLHAFYGQAVPKAKEVHSEVWEDCSTTLTSSACDWCLVLYDQPYAAFTRALAAVCPAIFAGVTNIYALAVLDKKLKEEPQNLKLSLRKTTHFDNAARLASLELGAESDSNMRPELDLDCNMLAAWELAGVEDVLAIPNEELLPLLQRIVNKKTSSSSSGRVLVLGEPAWKAEVMELFSGQSIRVWAEGSFGKILLGGAVSKDTVKAVKALHPGITIQVLGKGSGSNASKASILAPSSCFAFIKPDVLNLSEPVLEDSSQPFHRLCLDEAHAGCWIWPDLDLAFFKQHMGSISCI